ncbi:hypothetical protein [Oceanicola sp. 502str15]|uniref:hypothetical protein n=1 Tax=Oceanicola sp. 502str15 TaxID=2696061 RepID=UPI0020943042|nr:hypothetical protein [Oceanicola sp. 502str15]MCO6384988.1 hypothetical protein [Oceanicola sp. 502str15]
MRKSTLFIAVSAIAALSFSAVSGLVRSEAAVPEAAVLGPSAAELAAAYPQAWAMHRAYAEFLDGPQWHGAFAVGEKGAFGAVAGYADRSVTRADALAHCAAFAADCRIVAEIIPAAPVQPGASHLSGPQAEALIGLQRGYAGTKAFAVDRRGYWGSASGFRTRAAAEAEAMAQCRAAQTDGHAPGRPGFACKLVWVGG